MQTPKMSRPQFPPGYVDNPSAIVPWEQVVERLSNAKNYWLASVRPNGHPHLVPRWGVFVDGKFYYDGSPETRHARNIAKNPHVVLHLESGEQALIVDGTASTAGKPSPELAQKLTTAYRTKYAESGYAPEPTQWDEGGLFVFTPAKVITWSNFMSDPTRYTFEE